VVPVGGRVNVLQFQQLFFSLRRGVVTGDKPIAQSLKLCRNGQIRRVWNVIEANAFLFRQTMHHS
jgi:hypothetical protein